MPETTLEQTYDEMNAQQAMTKGIIVIDKDGEYDTLLTALGFVRKAGTYIELEESEAI